jgi:hypothetical protein
MQSTVAVVRSEGWMQSVKSGGWDLVSSCLGGTRDPLLMLQSVRDQGSRLTNEDNGSELQLLQDFSEQKQSGQCAAARVQSSEDGACLCSGRKAGT